MRELDEWIALNVMGWHKFEQDPKKYKPECLTCGGGHSYVHNHYEPKFHGERSGNVPRYTTDTAAAFEVWKACLLKHGASDNQIQSLFVDDHYIVGIDGKFWHEAITLELAICKFARQLFTTQTEEKR